MQENLGQRVGEVGGDSRDGSTRGRIAEERDVTWAKLVRKGLEMNPKQDRTNRPVWSCKETNCQLPGCKHCQASDPFIPKKSNSPATTAKKIRKTLAEFLLKSPFLPKLYGRASTESDKCY